MGCVADAWHGTKQDAERLAWKYRMILHKPLVFLHAARLDAPISKPKF